MTRYVLETDTNSGNGKNRRWKILDDTSKQEIATLTHSGSMFFAESERFRTSAESADPFLALRTVLRTDDLWILDGSLRKVEPTDFDR